MAEDTQISSEGNEIFQAPPQSVEPNLTVEDYSPPPGGPTFDITGADAVPPPEESFFSLRTVIVFLFVILIIGGVIYLVANFISKGSGGGGNGAVSIKYWGLWEPKEVMEPLIEEYQKAHSNVKITYEMQSTTQYRERLQAAIARGEGPDVFRFHNSWLPMLKNDLAAIPNDIISINDFKKTFYPVAQNSLLLNNKFYGIPLEIDGLVLFYNQDLLTAAGFSSPPTNWDEFQNMAAKMTVKDGFGRVQTAGAAMGLASNVENFSDILGLLFYQNGADFKNFGSEQAVQALTYYTMFAQKQTGVWDEFQDNSVVAFSQGKVGLMFAPSWWALNIKSLAPNLNFKTAAVPQVKGGTKVSWATFWVEGVSIKSKVQREAFNFLKFLSSKESETKLFTNQAKGARVFGEPYSRVDLASTLSDNEFLAPVISQAPQMRSWYLSGRTFDNGINDRMVKYFEDAVNSVAQGNSPQGALGTASQGVSQLLTEYGIK